MKENVGFLETLVGDGIKIKDCFKFPWDLELLPESIEALKNKRMESLKNKRMDKTAICDFEFGLKIILNKIGLENEKKIFRAIYDNFFDKGNASLDEKYGMIILKKA